MFWIILNAIIVPFTIISIFFIIKFTRTILKMETAIENSLNALDGCYKNISEILTHPLFFDNAEIRQVVGEVKKAREAILYVANEISLNIEYEDSEIEEDVEKKQ